MWLLAIVSILLSLIFIYSTLRTICHCFMPMCFSSGGGVRGLISISITKYLSVFRVNFKTTLFFPI